MKIICLLFIVLSLSYTTVAAQSNAKKSSESQKLLDELAAKDAELFASIFSSCNPDKLKDLITEDFEFYHDKWGQTAKSGAEFIDAIRGMCERQKQGTDYRARREIVRNSVEVYPLNNYGAIQTGVHRFYKITEGKKDELTETAKFTHLWKKENGTWKLARVLSYDHRSPKGKALAEKVNKNSN